MIRGVLKASRSLTGIFCIAVMAFPTYLALSALMEGDMGGAIGPFLMFSPAFLLSINWFIGEGVDFEEGRRNIGQDSSTAYGLREGDVSSD